MSWDSAAALPLLVFTPAQCLHADCARRCRLSGRTMLMTRCATNVATCGTNDWPLSVCLVCVTREMYTTATGEQGKQVVITRWCVVCAFWP